MPQPRRAPATRERRPQLRVVAEPRVRRLSLGAVTVLVVGGVFAVLFGLVVFHTVLLKNQQQLDHLDAQVTQEQAHYQQLRLQVAQLEAPQRILDVATTKLGMVPPAGTTYLTPAASAATSSAGASQGTSPSDTAAPSDDGASAWPQVKPYLGAAP
ncbi:MAG TPA: cell division protein FtsL [Acidimicrobiales bacterium]|nr:cell division protein FtsL [Acidimicrobiales bacterium]